MKIWSLFYLTAFAFNAVDGYYSVMSGGSDATGTGWFGITLTCLAVGGSMIFIVRMLNRRLKPEHFELPSWNAPLYKPLQFTRFLVLFALSAVAGATFALPYANPAGRSNFVLEFFLAFTALITERIIHHIYRNKIPTELETRAT